MRAVSGIMWQKWPVVFLVASVQSPPSIVQPPPSDKVVIKSTDPAEIKAARTYLQSAGIACKQHVERLEKLGSSPS